MKKKLICIALAAALIFSLCVPAAAADIRTLWTDITYRGIKIVINDVEIAPCDEKGNSTEPFIMNDTTYLPVRAIAGALGLNVGWEAATSTVVLEKGGEANYGNGRPVYSFDVKHVSITYRGTKISLDGENIPLVNRNGESVEPFIYNGTNYLPLRVVSEALGLSVGWDGATSTVTLKGGFEEEEELPPITEKVLMPLEEKYYMGYTGFASSFEEVGNVQYVYNNRGQLLSVKGLEGAVDMTLTYDSKARLQKASIMSNGVEFLYEAFYGESGELEAYFEDGVIRDGHMVVKDAQGRVIKEAYIDDEGYSQPVTEYKYDAQGRLELKTTIDLGRYSNGQHVCNNTYERYYYNEDGHLVKTRIRIGPSEEQGGSEVYWYYVPDEAGRTVEKGKYSSDGEVIEAYAYKYDEFDRVIEKQTFHVTSAGMFGGATYQTSIIEYAYDAYGNIISEKSMYYNMPNKEATFEEYVLGGGYEKEYSFDGEGRKLRDYYRSWGVDGYETIAENTWSYDENGLLLEETQSYKSNSGEHNGSANVYTYNDKGLLLENNYYTLKDGERTLSNKSSYVYDDAGNLLEYTDRYADGNVYVKEVYEYDAMGNLLSFVSGDGIRTNSAVYYEYDENGNPVKTETVSPEDGISVITEISYGYVPKGEYGEFFDIAMHYFRIHL